MQPLGEKVLPSRSYAVLDSHQRMLDRQAAREENQARERELMDAAEHRRKRLTVEDRVQAAVLRLKGTTYSDAIALITGLSDFDRDAFLLAEEIGENRAEILRRFPGVRKSVRLAWQGEASQPEAQEVVTPVATPKARPAAKKNAISKAAEVKAQKAEPETALD